MPFHFLLCSNLFNMQGNLNFLIVKLKCTKSDFSLHWFKWSLSISRHDTKKRFKFSKLISICASVNKLGFAWVIGCHIFKTKRNKINEKTILTHAKMMKVFNITVYALCKYCDKKPIFCVLCYDYHSQTTYGQEITRDISC